MAPCRIVRALQIIQLDLRVLARPLCATIALISTALLFLFYIAIPVYTVPGTTFAFQLAQTSPLQYALLIALAGMTGIIIAFEVYAFRRSRMYKRDVARTGTGFFASIVGGVLAAASCGCGTGIILGLVGLGGGAAFVMENQTAITVAMLLAVAAGLYFSARRAAGVCATCTV